MRPPRIIILVAFFFTSVLLTYLSLRSSSSPEPITTTSTASRRAGFRAFFSTPFSLFPPNAIITLTHDNTTAFLARPAAFGPLLPEEGLKGQVWIGSGFGDDGAEGELGCSDVPGWGESNIKPVPKEQDGKKSKDVRSSGALVGRRTVEEDSLANEVEDSSKEKADGKKPSSDDGTDDYLHHPLPDSKVTNPSDKHAAEPTSNHADIQSIQESAEIAGKIVLLSRGGCGFLEKVKWAQRRGAIALIVGDDTTGGPLIQMYARGDTSNVSIPAVFTSRTTAHLLSSLMGPGSYIEDTLDENGDPVLKVQHMDKSKESPKKHSARSSGSKVARATTNNRGASRSSSKKKSPSKENKPAPITNEKQGWFSRLIFGSRSGGSQSDSSRPPSSGQLDWVLVDDFQEDEDTQSKKSSKTDKMADKDKGDAKPGSANKQAAGDDFVIGVQDWRDPDLVGSAPTNDDKDLKMKGKSDATKPKNGSPQTKGGKNQKGGSESGSSEKAPPLRGGSIVPGSGEYNERQPSQDQTAGSDGSDDSGSSGALKGLLSAVFGDDEDEPDVPGAFNSGGSNAGSSNNRPPGPPNYDGDDDEEEGLWVTLTPTSGASPFLDTLLVLVVSPLVTLTIVYTLLLVRSRIRRRRWRAPKSIVDRLPVRTYQTIRSGTQSPRQPSPSSASPTTPLLQSSESSRPRPRSRTTSSVPEPGDIARVNSTPLEVPGPSTSTRPPEHEKNSSVSSEWKKYMGRQVECVVCLEEYVPGVSRVMSLPCGHEFHVDCITPWLITRRRTCPICKGDVVRSLARGSPSSPRYEPYQEDSDDDIEAQAVEATAALPIPGMDDEEEDSAGRERTASPLPSRSRRNVISGSWRGLLGVGSSSRSPRPAPHDRDR
ncbi:hypothetical protein F5884DRAFT_480358 [Xylogone sp. PMI_703]|nr:hypothetical protein F5884DRAFT_480358 [Xylogone sp. PMI_703]